MYVETYCPKCNAESCPVGSLQKIDDGGPHIQGTFYCDECDEEFSGRVEMTLFVNVYLVGRAYGGPEEGGWWYDYGYPVASVPADTWADAEDLKQRFERSERYSNEGRRSRYSVSGGEEYQVCIEDDFAESFPQRTPRFE